MVNSMTGFAAQDVAGDGQMRAWEIRSVNGKGLDIRMRLPDRLGRLETAVRDRLKTRLARGNVTVNLRITRDSATGAVSVDETALMLSLIHI